MKSTPFLFTICFLLFSLNTKAQSWEQTFINSNGQGKGFDVVETSDGGFVICGEFDLPTGAPRHYTWAAKADANGNELWSRVYNYNAITQEQAKALVVTPDGGFLIAGNTMVNTPQVLKISASGDSLWRKEYSLNNPARVNSIIPKPDGNGFLLAGSKLTGIIESSFWIASIDNEGELLWEESYLSGIESKAMEIKMTTVGDYLLCGSIQFSQVAMLKINADGTELWSKLHQLSTTDEGISIEEMTNGEILLGGYSTGFAGNTPFLLHLDADGNEIDQSIIDVVGSGAVSDIEKTSDGGYILTGSGFSFWNNIATDPGFILKLNAALEPQWDSILSNDQTHGTAILETADGGYIMSGFNETGMLLKKIAGMTNSNEEVLENELAVKVYPNPTTDKLIFEFSMDLLATDLHLKLYSSEGRLVRSQVVDEAIEVMLLKGLATGSYSYVVQNGNRILRSGVVAKQ